jgi:hypothetical protein
VITTTLKAYRLTAKFTFTSHNLQGCKTHVIIMKNEEGTARFVSRLLVLRVANSLMQDKE